MPKTSYIAIDPTGAKHTRTTLLRTYTHAVLWRPSHRHAVMAATGKDWVKTDSSNYRYYVEIAEGRDPYPQRVYLRDGDTEEQKQAMIARVAATNAARVVDAKKRIGTMTLDDYLADRQRDRLEQVEKLRESGYYDRFKIAGFCGRHDLAQKLCGAQAASPYVAEAVIVEAVVAPAKAKKEKASA